MGKDLCNCVFAVERTRSGKGRRQGYIHTYIYVYIGRYIYIYEWSVECERK